MLSFDQFINKWNGRGIDFDNAYGYQCVDLYRQYLKEVLGFTQSPPVRGAADIWTTYRQQDFTRVANTLTNTPKRGDIVIWNAKTGGGFGHVAVVDSANVLSLRVFEQDGLVGNGARFATRYYSNIFGWLTPKTAPIAVGDDQLLNQIKHTVDGAGTPKEKITKIREILK